MKLAAPETESDMVCAKGTRTSERAAMVPACSWRDAVARRRDATPAVTEQLQHRQAEVNLKSTRSGRIPEVDKRAKSPSQVTQQFRECDINDTFIMGRVGPQTDESTQRTEGFR